ncbi:DoxX family protein [Sphaerimonospora thailandensis]|uniref:Integral membrane protein n=1 Tax=Sphaerimonospora thailandensis TaxID=795644 RepID=A0A8J3RGA1_9ACTN|nr:DoxX family protein [Sphaerimonospora thailandensis]GIH73179.1 integral membrane protein [Sphaerimonospora thailandensis]
MKFDRHAGPVLSLFRIVTGLLFVCHGLSSVFNVFGGNQGSGHAIPIGTWPGWWAALIQVICGGLVLIGLFTRAGAFLSSGSMAYAYFVVHQPHAVLPLQNGGELPVVFCWSFFLLFVLGPGPWSLDALIRRGESRAEAPAPVLAEASAPVLAEAPAEG